GRRRLEKRSSPRRGLTRPSITRVCSIDRCSVRSWRLKAQVSTTWLPRVLTSFTLQPAASSTALPVRAGTSIVSVVILVSPRSRETLQELPRPWRRRVAEEALRRRGLDHGALVA